MKMSAARIRSVFRRYNSVEDRVFHLSRNPRPVAISAPEPVSAIAAQPDSARVAALNRHYRAAMKCELPKAGL